MEVAGASSLVAESADSPYDLDEWQRLFLFSRADTIYGGSNEIQRNIVAEHNLLEGKIVVVTAAGAGIGAAIARRCLEEHALAVVLVNNAGLGGTASVLEMTDEQWTKVIDVTLTGTFRCVRAASKQMVAAGTRGVIVNNASVVGWRAQEARPTTPRRRPG